jgi:hypothetical protein
MIVSQQQGIDASGHQQAANILSEMIRGYRLSQLIYVAATLGIADHLAKEPRTPEALAEIVGAQPRNLSRVLRTLATQGIFKQRDDGRYELTPLAEPLQSEAPNSMRDLAMMVCDEAFWRPCGQLLHTVRTGQVGFEQAFGVDFWTYLAKQHEFAAFF